MTKVFYDSVSNKEIHDISGEKSVEDIKKEFGEAEYQEVTIENDEVFIVENGVASRRKVIDVVDEQEFLIQKKIKQRQRSAAIIELKQEGKLPEDFKDNG
jgi:hypothetical protein